METLKIEIPKGYQIDSVDASSGVIKFKEKPKDVLERIQTDEDVLADNGHDWDSFNEWCDGLDEDERATRFLKLLNKSLNGEWTPDFDNPNQYKYEPRFVGGSSGFRYYGCDDWYSGSGVGSRLCYKEGRLAVHAGTKYTKWYKSVIVIKQN
jgi:hypothetical protein